MICFQGYRVRAGQRDHITRLLVRVMMAYVNILLGELDANRGQQPIETIHVEGIHRRVGVFPRERD